MHNPTNQLGLYEPAETAVLPGRPVRTDGVRFYLADGDEVELYVGARNAAYAAPSLSFTLTGPGTFDEPLSLDDVLFCVSSTGSPVFRWIQR